MNSESKINVNYSALVSLKAELLRKQAEVQHCKAAQHRNAQQASKPKAPPKPKKDKEPLKRKTEEKKDENLNDDDVNAHKKSKLMLEAKSKLYSQMTKAHATINPNFLVDFQNKEEEPVDESPPDEEIRSESPEDNDNEVTNGDSDSDSEWVEYQDCFGRTRKCLREDLAKMKEKDEKLKADVLREPEERPKKNLFYEDRTPAKEPEIEIMRRKWEEQMEKLADKTDIHYQDILFDEARTHGVGYYAFSHNEEERAKQQANLMNLRKETQKKQKETLKIRDMKEKIEKNRLRVARIRQRVRAGLPVDDLEDEIQEEPENAITEETQSEKSMDKESDRNKMQTQLEKSSKLEEKEHEEKVQAMAESIGKRNRWYVMSQEEWVEKRREDRINDFAPKYENFKKGETINFVQSKISDRDDSDSCDSDIIGPMPPKTAVEHQKLSDTEDCSNIEDSVEAGLKFLREQFEKQKRS